MTNWSGAENLTTCIVLFCGMARLRAENRGKDLGPRTPHGGLLLLDNPLGRANYVPFLHLQRSVAAANGVQLVFSTPVGDLGVVTVFPRIAPMRKRPSSSKKGAFYVVHDTDRSSVEIPVGQQALEATRALRLEAAR